MDSLMGGERCGVKESGWRVDGKVGSNKVEVSKAIRIFFFW